MIRVDLGRVQILGPEKSSSPSTLLHHMPRGYVCRTCRDCSPFGEGYKPVPLAEMKSGFTTKERKKITPKTTDLGTACLKSGSSQAPVQDVDTEHILSCVQMQD